MSNVFSYDGQYFRIVVLDVAAAERPDEVKYASWCSDAFRELKDTPQQTCSRFVAGSPFASRADALRHAQEWIKSHWDKKVRRAQPGPGKRELVYTVSLFRGDIPTDHVFPEFSDARLFAESAKKEVGITKVGITNNESPEYLIVWEKEK